MTTICWILTTIVNAMFIVSFVFKVKRCSRHRISKRWKCNYGKCFRISCLEFSNTIGVLISSRSANLSFLPQSSYQKVTFYSIFSVTSSTSMIYVPSKRRSRENPEETCGESDRDCKRAAVFHNDTENSASTALTSKQHRFALSFPTDSTQQNSGDSSFRRISSSYSNCVPYDERSGFSNHLIYNTTKSLCRNDTHNAKCAYERDICKNRRGLDEDPRNKTLPSQTAKSRCHFTNLITPLKLPLKRSIQSEDPLTEIFREEKRLKCSQSSGDSIISYPSHVFRIILGNVTRKICEALSACVPSLRDKRVQKVLFPMIRNFVHLIEFQQGEYVLKRHGNVQSLIVIEEGTVQFLYKGQLWGKQVGPGAILGMPSFVLDMPSTTDAVSTSPKVFAWSLNAYFFEIIRDIAAKEASKVLAEVPVFTNAPEVTFRNYQFYFSCRAEKQEGRGEVISSEIAFDQLERAAFIASGGFGSVYLVRDKENQKDEKSYFCLKRISKKLVSHEQYRAFREKNALLETAASPFIISLVATYQDADSIYFLTEFAQGGDLGHYMAKVGALPHEQCKFFCANIVLGLLHLHEKGFVHRDLKPQNILINKNGYLKICDLGLAIRLPCSVQMPWGGIEFVEKAFKKTGTIPYLAPELIAGNGYGPEIDIWSLGVILVEMYTGKHPFDAVTVKMMKEKLCRVETDQNTFTTPNELKRPELVNAKNFASQLLRKSSERLGHDELKDHEYFASFDFLALTQEQMPAPYVPVLSSISDLSYFNAKSENEKEIEQYRDGDGIFNGFS